jgi:hypothetical protein
MMPIANNLRNVRIIYEPSITYWTRLETRTRNEQFDKSLEARIFDPLWMMARQLSLGSFKATDAGSATRVDLQYEIMPISYFRSNNANVESYDKDSPLEVLVESEPVENNIRISVMMGKSFLKLLKNIGIDTSTDLPQVIQYFTDSTKYGVLPSTTDDDPATVRFLSVASSVSVDGIRLYRDLKGTVKGATPSLPPSVQTDLQSIFNPDTKNTIPKILKTATAFVEWFEAVYHVPANSNAWTRERLEYEFETAAPDETGNLAVLDSPDYYGDNIDWYDFSFIAQSDFSTVVGQENLPVSNSQSTTTTVMPAHMVLKGMPKRRWWEFEDAQLDIGNMEVDPNDMSKMMIMDFVLNHSNDWYIIPLSVPIGSLVKIQSLTVTDTFGDTIMVQPANAVSNTRAWSMFSISTEESSPTGQTSYLLIPPNASFVTEGPVLESVNFFRDEVADMVWAVEDKIQNKIGDPVNGQKNNAVQTVQGSAAGSPTAGMPKYLLMSNVPENWIPFLVAADQTGQDTILQKGAMLTADPVTKNPEPVYPRGIILEPTNDIYFVRDEEVPREGTILTRKFKFARWIDGSGFLWMGRTRTVGKGEGLSGLRFDAIMDDPTGG